ncbi:plasmid mobilization relaxosome protein MobC [Photobacterium damselae]
MAKERRTKEIKIRVSETELEQIRKNANQNIAFFMRELALGNKIEIQKEKPAKKFIKLNENKADAKLIEQIRRCGVSLNQIARAVNYKMKSGETLQIAMLNSHVLAVQAQLSELIRMNKNAS